MTSARSIAERPSAADDSGMSDPTLNSYDPKYDPLVDPGPGRNRDYAPTYWIDTAGTPPADDGPVSQDVDVDVAVIGSGYTGLACAIFLAQEHGIKATVLEANRVCWGCSTRNGGQAQIASGRLTRSQWIKRWGLDTARELHAEISEAFDVFRSLILSGKFDCEPQRGGHLYIAHRPRPMQALTAESEILNRLFNYNTEILDADTVRNEYVDDREAAGAMLEPDGIGIHAARLAFGYLNLARELGATVHPSSPVLGWEARNGVYHVRTPGGTVRARAVAIATGGYTPPGLHPLVKNRIMPILSNSVVTRPMTEEEKAACNFKTHLVITDTRKLRYYYRHLPDGRLQIGSRSAITGADADDPKYLALLLEGMARKFPALRGIDIDYSWWGWVDVSHDMMPRICQPDPNESVYYSLGYGGNGVMYSAQAGRRMAEKIAGKSAAHTLPIYTSSLPGHLFAPFRRMGQRMLYQWYYLRDEVL